ncbi:MAG: hypothetical protein LAO24_02815 [Acidobacteriia bacterium]|nr:hypothetical protein [Terriglobia bacterium]
MATATAPRNDLYLSVLAGRAVTALADLAGNPTTWNDRIEKDLRGGIVYCQAVRAQGGRVLGKTSSGWNALKRSVGNASEAAASSTDISAEAERVERYLSDLVSNGDRAPKMADLVAAIEFLGKTATDR